MKRFIGAEWVRRLFVSKKQKTPKGHVRKLTVEELEVRLSPATRIWDGGAADNAWTNPANWVQNVAPRPGDDLIFQGFAANPAGLQPAVNTFPVNTRFNSITFTGDNFRLSGNPIVLGSPGPNTGYMVSNRGAVDNEVNFNILLGGSAENRQFFTVAEAGASMTVRGRIFSTSPVQLTKNGPGTLVLANDNSGYTGTITIVDGPIQIRNSRSLGSSARPTIVLSSFPARGQLQIADVVGAVNEPLILNGAGPVNDGALLNIAGNNVLTGRVTLDSDSTIASNSGQMLLNGVIADRGSGHDLTKEGPAKVVFDPIRTAAGNAYRGQTLVNNGILEIRHSRALGNSPSPIRSIGGVQGNDTIVNTFPNRSGTLELAFVPDSRRIDPFASRVGFAVPNEALTLNGPGVQGIHVRPKEAGPNGVTVFGALYNRTGNNAWNRTINLWSDDGAAANYDALVWGQPAFIDPAGTLTPAINYATVGIGAEVGTTLVINGSVVDDGLTQQAGSPDLTAAQYALIKTRPGRVVFVNRNSYRGRTEILEGFLNIRDSQSLGTTGFEQNGTYVFQGGSLELEADARPDSRPGGFSPDGRLHLSTDLVVSDESLFLMGAGQGGFGALRNILGTNEIEGIVPLVTRLDRGNQDLPPDGRPTGVSFRDRGASVRVEPDRAPFNLNNLSQLTLSGEVKDGSFLLQDEVRLGRTYKQGSAVPADLFKTGLGELVLTADATYSNGQQATVNTYTGVTFIQEGWVTARNNDALGGDELMSLSPPLLPGKDNNQQDIPTAGPAVLPNTRVANGAALHLKRTRQAGANITLDENVWLFGPGLRTHRVAQLNKGALLNLSGNNSVTGDINIIDVGYTGQGVTVGAELDPLNLGTASSELTLSGQITDQLGVLQASRNQIAGGLSEDRYQIDTATKSGSLTLTFHSVVFPDQPDTFRVYYQGNRIFDSGPVVGPVPLVVTLALNGTARFVEVVVNEGRVEYPYTRWSYTATFTPRNTGPRIDLNKAGQKRLVLQGPGVYAGDFNLLEGTVRVQNDTALGISYRAEPANIGDFTAGTTFVRPGTALEFAGHNPAVNAGVASGVQVYENLVLTGVGLVETQRVRVLRTAGPRASFRLTYGGRSTALLPFGASAAQVQVALDSLPTLGAGGVVVTRSFDANSNAYVYSVTFGIRFSGADTAPITGSGVAVLVTSGTSVVGGTRALTNIAADNHLRGTVTINANAFNPNIGADVRQDSRLSLWGNVGGLAGVSKGGFGKMVLGGDNSYAGTTIVSLGIVNAQSSSAFGLPSVLASRGGTIVANNAQIEVQNDVTIGGEALTMLGNGPNSAPNIQPTWLVQGPGPTVGSNTNGAENVTGRVTSVATDPTDPNRIYLTAASGGAWRSKNGGLTWEPMIDQVNDPTYTNQVLFASTVAVAPSDPRVLYVALGNPLNSVDSYYGRGVLKSTDGGDTWSLVAPPPGTSFDRHVISKLVVDPTNADIFYIAVGSEGVNGIDAATDPAAAFGIYRFTPALPALTQLDFEGFFYRNRPAVPAGWVKLTDVQPNGPVFTTQSRFTDLVVMNLNPRLSSPEYPENDFLGRFMERPEYRMVTFAVGDYVGHDSLEPAVTSNAAYLGIFTDFADVIPGAPGIRGAATDDDGWTQNGFPAGNETINNIPTPRNGNIKLTGVRPVPVFPSGITPPEAPNPEGRLSRVITQYASVAFPVNVVREFFTNQDGAFRQMLSMNITYNPAVNVLEWQLGGWGNVALPASAPTLAGGTVKPDSVPFPQGQSNITGNGWYASTLAVNPANATQVFLAGVGQPYTAGPFYIDAATAANSADLGLLNPAPRVNYHASTFDALGRLIVGTDGGVWRLTSFGPNGTWENINGSGLQIAEVEGLDVDPFNPLAGVVSSVANGSAVYSGSQYFRFNNTGATYARLLPNGQVIQVPTGHGGLVRIHPQNPNILYLQQDNLLLRSNDRGANWVVINTVTRSPVFNATGTANSIQFTIGAGLPYQYNEPAAYPYMVPQFNEQRFFGESNPLYPGYTSSNGFVFVLDQYNPARLVVVNRSVIPLDNDINIVQEALFSETGQPVFRTIGDVSKWFPGGLGANGFVKVTSVALGRFEGPTRVDPAFPTNAQFNGPDSYDPNTVYVLTNQGLFVTMNGGNSWVRRDTGLPVSTRTSFFAPVPPLEEYGDLLVDPNNRNVAYVVRHTFRSGAAGATDGQVYRTTDAGLTWVNISGDLPDSPVWKVTANTRNGDLYVGNDQGVYRIKQSDLDAGDFTWTRQGVGLPNVQVKQMVFNPLTNTLTAGTFGRGVYTLHLDDNTDDFEANRFNRGAVRSSTGSSVWTGNITMSGPTDIRTERDSQINFLGSITENRPNANYAVNKAGTGRVTLSSRNNIGGTVNVVEGALRVAHPQGLGTTTLVGRTVVNANASLELQTNLVGERVELRGPGQVFNGLDTGALRNVSNNNTFTGTLVLFADSTIGVESGSTLTIGVKAGLPGVGVIAPAAPDVGYTKTGTGTLVVNTANAYTGDTFINEGLVVVTSARGLGPANSGKTYVRAGAALQIVAPAMAPTPPGGDDGTIKPAAATAPLTFVGEALCLEGTGIANGGALIIVGAVTWQGPITLVSVPPFQPLASITVSNNLSSLVVVGVVDGTGGLIKAGPGRLTMARDNTYLGRTIIVAGPLRILTALGLGSTAGDTEVRDGGVLELFNAAGMTIADEDLRLVGRGLGPVFAGALTSLAGNNVWTGDIVLTGDAGIGVNTSTTLRLTGTITDTVPSNLTKKGLGQLIIDGLGSYNGVTFIVQGDLTVNGTIGNVVLAGGNLRGDGGVGTITTSAPNSIVAPGGAAPTGQLDSNSVVWRPDVRFFVTVNGTAPGAGHDKLLVNGNITLGGATLLGNSGPAIAVGEQVNIIETVGGTVIGQFAGLPNGSFVTLGGRRFRIIYTANAVVLRRE